MLSSVTFDQAPYYPLVSGAVSWVDIENIQPYDTVVILGQGLVDSLLMQVAKANGRGRIITVDALDSRCSLSEELGADVVINSSDEDPVRAIHRITNAVGAHDSSICCRRTSRTEGLRPGPGYARCWGAATSDWVVRRPTVTTYVGKNPTATTSR